MGGALDLAAEQLPEMKKLVGRGVDIYLLLGITEGQEKEKLSKPWQVLSKVVHVDSHTHSRSTKPGPRMLEIPGVMSDGLFINLTRMFRRLGIPLEDAAAAEEFHRRFPDARRIVTE